MVPMKYRRDARFAVFAAAATGIAFSALFSSPSQANVPEKSALSQKTVDEFGQSIEKDWPEKLHKASEFTQRRSAEQASLESQPEPSDRDAYGGWTKGPTLKASGYFRTAQVQGKWWFVTPSGHLFFSTGIAEVTDGSKSLDLPKHSLPKGQATHFYQANLNRKYGSDYHPLWRDLTFKRFNSWGFNTLGSDADLDLCRLDRMPYTLSAKISGDFNHLSVSTSAWGGMCDAFDPKFPKAVAKCLAVAVGHGKEDPWCIGYFVDNELPWTGYGPKANYALALGAFVQDAATSPAKQAFVSQLQAKYGTIDKLNTAWNSRLASWDELKLPHTASGNPNDARKADFTNFVRSLAHRYYSIVNSELKRQDAHHLYLGSCFSSFTPEVAQEAAKYCDVISFDITKPTIDANQWGFWDQLNKPCLSSKFGFGASDRGFLVDKIIDAKTQSSRATMYRDYTYSAMDNPNLIGYQWFQYIDETALSETSDKENDNCGLVDVTDTPYAELTAAAQQTNREIYTRRYDGVK